MELFAPFKLCLSISTKSTVFGRYRRHLSSTHPRPGCSERSCHL